MPVEIQPVVSYSGHVKKRTILFGASGLLGSGLLHLLRQKGESSVLPLAWNEVGPTAPADWVAKRVLPFAQGADQVTVVFANGITNPRLPVGEIRASNVEFPFSVISALRERPQFRFLTIGTIFENFPQACAANAYLGSKLELGSRMSELSRGGVDHFLHVRLHTVYGARMAPHMFLGQVARAIATRTPFAMSSGEQMREYHHVDDVSGAFGALLDRDWEKAAPGGIVQINSGEPVRLAELAREVFKDFGMEDLLQIGAIPGASADNKEKVFERSPEWLLARSRPAIPGVIAAIRESLRA